MTLFVVRTTPRYERLARALFKAHAEFGAVQASARLVLGADPTNRSGAHHVKKLTNVPQGERQWRLALGRNARLPSASCIFRGKPVALTHAGAPGGQLLYCANRLAYIDP